MAFRRLGAQPKKKHGVIPSVGTTMDTMMDKASRHGLFGPNARILPTKIKHRKRNTRRSSSW